MKTVYLAGPMNQWEDRGRGNGESDFVRDPSMPAPWRSEVMKRARRFKYVFPEMNEYWGHAHDIFGSQIPQQDIDLIKRCDIILAFVDQPDRIGTLCEISAAYALNKQILSVSIERSHNSATDWADTIPWFVDELINKHDYVMLSDDATEPDSVTDEDSAMKIAIDLIVKMLGGDSIDYYKYIESLEWKTKADAAKERAGHRCQICNRPSIEITLDAHHRTYERLGNELPEDITVLCRNCHELYESNKKLNGNGKAQHVD